MPDIPLGVHSAESGNRCTVTLRVQKPAKATVDFAGDRVPTADDREEWSLAILGESLEGALEGSNMHSANRRQDIGPDRRA